MRYYNESDNSGLNCCGGGRLIQLFVEEDNDKELGGDIRCARLLLGVDCFLLQLPPLADGGGREWLLQRAGEVRGLPAEEAGGVRGLPAEEGFQY